MKCPQCGADTLTTDCPECDFDLDEYNREILSNEFDMLDNSVLNAKSAGDLQDAILKLSELLRKELLK